MSINKPCKERFGKIKSIPVMVYHNRKIVQNIDWEDELWIEKAEDWYALSSPQLVNKKIRIIEKSVWEMYNEEECK